MEPDGCFDSNHAYVVIHGFHIVPTEEMAAAAADAAQQTVVISRSRADYALSAKALEKHSKGTRVGLQQTAVKSHNSESISLMHLPPHENGLLWRGDIPITRVGWGGEAGVKNSDMCEPSCFNSMGHNTLFEITA